MSSDRQIGNVKWFNNKAGFGFITIGENTDSPKDVFAHYSNINVKNSQYKYLVQCEYVEFDLTPTTEGEHEFQATNITGIQGGATLCERRKISRDAAIESDANETPRTPRTPQDKNMVRPQVLRRQVSNGVQPSGQARRPRAKPTTDADGFTTVQKKRPAATPRS